VLYYSQAPFGGAGSGWLAIENFSRQRTEQGRGKSLWGPAREEVALPRSRKRLRAAEEKDRRWASGRETIPQAGRLRLVDAGGSQRLNQVGKDGVNSLGDATAVAESGSLYPISRPSDK